MVNIHLLGACLGFNLTTRAGSSCLTPALSHLSTLASRSLCVSCTRFSAGVRKKKRNLFQRLCACVMNKGSNLTGMPHLQMQLANLTPTYEPTGPLLPEPATPELSRRITLVLDLDETLVHSSFVPMVDADFVLPLQMGGDTHMVFVRKRPRVDAFLAAVSRWYEVIVFTASLALYANPVVDELDNGRAVHGRLYREHCVLVGSHFVKDLARLGRPLSRTLIIDNSPLSYVLQPENAVPISGFVDDPNDRELDKTLAFLEAARHLEDVRHRGGPLSAVPLAGRPLEDDAVAASASGNPGGAPICNGTMPEAAAASRPPGGDEADSMDVDAPRDVGASTGAAEGGARLAASAAMATTPDVGRAVAPTFDDADSVTSGAAPAAASTAVTGGSVPRPPATVTLPAVAPPVVPPP